MDVPSDCVIGGLLRHGSQSSTPRVYFIGHTKNLVLFETIAAPGLALGMRWPRSRSSASARKPMAMV